MRYWVAEGGRLKMGAVLVEHSASKGNTAGKLSGQRLRTHGTSHKPRLVLTLAALHSKLRLRPELRLSGGRMGLLAGELEEPRHTGKERNQMWAHVSRSLTQQQPHILVFVWWETRNE